jgi:hypothetical protein
LQQGLAANSERENAHAIMDSDRDVGESGLPDGLAGTQSRLVG